MSAPAVSAYPVLERLVKGASDLPGGKAPAIAKRRTEAIARVGTLALPTTQHEDWRFTNLAPLQALDFMGTQVMPEVSRMEVERFFLPEADGSRLVFVNGYYAAHLSSTKGLPSGVSAQALAECAEGALLEQHLGRHAEFENEAFTALNTARLCDGAVVLVRQGTVCATPIQLLFVSVPGTEAIAQHPRTLVVLEAVSEATVVEDYVSLGEGRAFTNAVTEVVLGDDAQLRHVRIQRENLASYHIGKSAATLSRDSGYVAHNVTVGAGFSRHEPVIRQSATGMDATLRGLTVLSGEQFADTHSTLDHAKPHGNSHQVHKCILDDRARAVFNGKVLVRKDAQATDSSQQSRNLLLSDGARIDTKPQLEIFADDVKCAHGATIGQLEAEEVFYLRSRGLDEARARHLLTYAFAAEVLDGIPVASVKEQLRGHVLDQMHVGR